MWHYMTTFFVSQWAIHTPFVPFYTFNIVFVYYLYIFHSFFYFYYTAVAYYSFLHYNTIVQNDTEAIKNEY